MSAYTEQVLEWLLLWVLLGLAIRLAGNAGRNHDRR